ncbi:MoaD/ThiS family protein [Halopiger aswanensis]|uniref:Molybdopterin converting factor small subunit n=1 Tax=Halopiger aswanensis TaxID=148449 RepID=A0A419WQM3_9EURY|nr:MoaD/ThiS family protein [Halopiger aswanensis]RKD97698.1 molybdopterin converting factor small subunit [Halopiger aswanensis]
MTAEATHDQTTDSDRAAESAAETTTVTVRCTGHVREAVGTHELEFTFEGTQLQAFLETFFEDYDVEELLIAETEEEATAHGWAEPPEELPGTWRKNPEGEQTRTYARVCVNGKFNELLDGFQTELEDGDRVALIYPFMFCC